jgi:hypothetical protein
VQDFAAFTIGESAERVKIETSAEARAAAVSMARQGRRTVDILSRQLDPPLYDDADFVAAIQRLILGSARARVRILLQNVQPLLVDGHRLLRLAERLPTYITVRIPGNEHREVNRAFLVVDERASLYRSLADRYEGSVCFNDPAGARALVHDFELIWQKAAPDPNLRSMRV